jgi:hypothetical protein
MMRRKRSWLSGVPVGAGIGVLALAVGLAFGGACGRSAAVDLADQGEEAEGETFSGKPPLLIKGFVAYISEGKFLRDEIHAESASLDQQSNIAHLHRIHMDFHKPEGGPKDTLDAPEGYLYLNDMDLLSTHPLYQKIGGINAITSSTFADMLPPSKWLVRKPRRPGTGPKIPAGAHSVYRGQNDMDLIGTSAAKIVFRRMSVGTQVTCLRGWRCVAQSRLYGMGECEWIQPQADSNQALVAAFDKVTVDDQLTSGVVNMGGHPKIRNVTLASGTTSATAKSQTPKFSPRPKAKPTPARKRPDKMALPALPDSP